MEITSSQEQGRVPVTVFHLKGDITDGDVLQENVREAFDAGARNIVLDMTEVPYIASSALRGIHSVYMMLRDADSGESNATVYKGIAAGTYKSPHLKLVNPSKHVLQILSATGYDMFLEIHKKVREAVASF